MQSAWFLVSTSFLVPGNFPYFFESSAFFPPHHFWFSIVRYSLLLLLLSSFLCWQMWVSLPCPYWSVVRHVGGNGSLFPSCRFSVLRPGGSTDLILSIIQRGFLYKIFVTSQQPSESEKVIPIYRGRNEDWEQQRAQGRDPVGAAEDSFFSLWASVVSPSLKLSRLRLPWLGVCSLGLRPSRGRMSLSSHPQGPSLSDHPGLSLTASRFNVEVKHIKIMTAEGLYRITEKKAFRGLTVRTNLP